MENGQLIVTKQMMGCMLCEDYSLKHKFIDGKLYCMDCYPQMVDVYLADLRLKKIKMEVV